jgi:hypothetical protein
MFRRRVSNHNNMSDVETMWKPGSTMEENRNASRCFCCGVARTCTKIQGYAILVLITLSVVVVCCYTCRLAGSSTLHCAGPIRNCSGAGWVRPDVIYGLVHVAKTGGTEINGELAMHYERVCGNKGYSFDALEANKRFQKANIPNKNVHTDIGDSVAKLGPQNTAFGWNRNAVPDPLMLERGYDDCDYIAQELDADWWEMLYSQWKMELHIPCREPLGHLMSMCNFIDHEFDCQAQDLLVELEKCNLFLTRMGPELSNRADARFKLKCFNPIPPQPYLAYMGTILQRKRVEADYVHRESNRQRNKDKECIWKESQEFRDKVANTLRRQYLYYAFCGQCMGSKDELLLQ